jgi:L-fuculose-phosphate aldolase
LVVVKFSADALKEKVAVACNILAAQGLADYLGHVSCRVPGENSYLISPRATSLADVTANKVVAVTSDGKVMGGTGKVPGEIPIHLSIYTSRPDVMGITHTHSRFVTAFSIAREKIVPVHHVGVPFIDGVPLLEDYGLVNNAALADKVARTLGSKKAILLGNHGSVVVGRTVEEACVLTIWLERNCELQLLSKALGRTAPIPMDEESRSLSRHYLDGTAAAWNYYAALAKEHNGH